MEDELNGYLEDFRGKNTAKVCDLESLDFDVTVPSELQDCELEGLHWVAGIVKV